MIAGRFIQTSMPEGTCLSPLRRTYVINLDDYEENYEPNLDDLEAHHWDDICGKGWSRTYQIQVDRPSNRGAFTE